MSHKKKTSCTRKRKPLEIDTGGVFARHFEDIMQTIFKKAGHRPEPAQVINLHERRKDKKAEFMARE